MPRPGPRTVNVDWRDDHHDWQRYRATPERINVTNEDDGSLIYTLPLPTTQQTRLDLARLIAGDEYRVVLARENDDGWIAVQREEYARLLDRDQYPRVQGVCPSCGVGPLILGEDGHVTCSWEGCEHPDDATSLLHNPPAQPDRPEPVDPASIRVGDEILISTDDGKLHVEGRVKELEWSNPARPFCVDTGRWADWVDIDGATVRVLQRAEPEPDPAQVEALADALSLARSTGIERDRDVARELIRDHGVRLEVPDA